MQVLMSVKEFCEYFFVRDFQNITFDTHFQNRDFSQAVSKIVKEMWTIEEEYDFLQPAFFHKLIEKKFDKRMQHDAHEFLLFLFSQLQDELNPGPQSEAGKRFSMTSSQASCFWKNYKMAHPSIVD